MITNFVNINFFDRFFLQNKEKVDFYGINFFKKNNFSNLILHMVLSFRTLFQKNRLLLKKKKQ